MHKRTIVASLIVSVLTVAPARGQDVTLEELLRRTGDYVLTFIDQFSNVVAKEQYVQTITSPRRTRTLTSDFLLVRYPGSPIWLAFRDVIAIDDQPVREDKNDRLTALFLEPSEDAFRRASDIARASAKYNLADVGTINQPFIALAFLQPNYQPRFRFNLAGREKNMGPDVRIVRFREFVSPTILKGNSNSDIASQGLAWVEESTGRVLKTQLDIGRSPFGIRIVTSFQFNAELGIDVPIEMRDTFPTPTAGELRGVATYGGFRRFQVRTDETVN
jgi:hypothetical protein